MEINITIFIQAIIFLMLFVLLSKTLFYPLDKLFTERYLQTVGQQKKINNVNQEINKQKVYILKKTSLKIKDIEKLYNFWKYNNCNKEKIYIKSVQSSIQNKYNEVTVKLKNSKIVIEKELQNDSDKFITTIYNKIYYIS